MKRNLFGKNIFFGALLLTGIPGLFIGCRTELSRVKAQEASMGENYTQSEEGMPDYSARMRELLRKENPHAYMLLGEMTALGAAEGSPENDLNYAKTIRGIIAGDPYYMGDVEKALNDVGKLVYVLTESGSQGDINAWTDHMRLISSIRTSLAYDSLMSAYPDCATLRKEYVAWHNLLKAMACYQEEVYSAEYYLSVAEEMNTAVKEWFDYRREGLKIERDIISGKLIYAISPSKRDSIRGEREFYKLFSLYHSPDDTTYYHPMWNEIKASFDEWLSTRNNIAGQFDLQRSSSYREYTREVADSIFSYIKALDSPIFRPIL